MPLDIFVHAEVAPVAVAAQRHVQIARIRSRHRRGVGHRIDALRDQRGADVVDAAAQSLLRRVVERMRVVAAPSVVGIDLAHACVATRIRERAGQRAAKPMLRVVAHHAADQRLRLFRTRPQRTDGAGQLRRRRGPVGDRVLDIQHVVELAFKQHRVEAAARYQPLHDFDLDLERTPAAVTRILAQQHDVLAADIAHQTVDFGACDLVERSIARLIRRTGERSQQQHRQRRRDR